MFYLRRLLIESLLVRLPLLYYKGDARSHRAEEAQGQDGRIAIVPLDRHAPGRNGPDATRADPERAERTQRTVLRERARREQESLFSLKLVRVLHKVKRIRPDPRETAIKWLTVKDPRTARMVKSASALASSPTTTKRGSASDM